MAEDHLIRSIDSIRGLFNLYVITFASYALLGFIRFLNKRYYNEDDPIKFLELPVHSEYFSLIFGIAFLAFILVFHLMLLNFKGLVDLTPGEGPGFELIKKLKYVHWIASPLSIGKSGPYILFSMVSLGTVYALVLSLGHLFFPIPSKCHIPIWLFRLIGAFDLLVFIISLYLTRYWWIYFINLRGKIL